MDGCALIAHLATWTVVNVLYVLSQEVTVRSFDLKPCKKDNRVCVTDPRDCGPRPPSSVQKNLSMSCYYQISQSSMTCGWNEESNRHAEPDISLIFRSDVEIIYCPGIFNPAQILHITARIKNYMMGTEIWSQPHTVCLYDAVKPSRPVLTISDTAADSVHVSWRSTSNGSCRLRYRANHTHVWMQVAETVLAHQDQMLTYKIRDLLPFTVYRAAVCCVAESGIGSEWSSDVIIRTLDRVPSRPVEVCYRVERNDAGVVQLYLTWKDPNLCEPENHILGYQVSYEPSEKERQQENLVQNVTDVTALVLVEEGNYSVTVTAFSATGYGPAAHLNIDTKTLDALPSVRNPWVSSNFPTVKGLRVQWETPSGPSPVPPVSHFAVHWHSEMLPSTGCWVTVDHFNTSTSVQDVDPDESYLISVFPVYKQQCGAPQTLPASLRHGALMEADKLRVVGVTKMTVTVRWVWQRKPGPIRVSRYTMVLRKDSEIQTLSLWPDQWQHTFHNLKPNTEYLLLLLADNISRHTVSVRTDFDEAPLVATVTPLLLLAFAVFIIVILSRTLYKSKFFPPICSPQKSTAVPWLLDPQHQKNTESKILDLDDFRVTDVLGHKGVILDGPNSQLSSEEDLQEDPSLLLLSAKLSAFALDAEYVSTLSVIAEYQHPDDMEDCRHLDFQTQEGTVTHLRKPEQSALVDAPPVSRQRGTDANFDFCDFVAATNGHVTCGSEYIDIESMTSAVKQGVDRRIDLSNL